MKATEIIKVKFLKQITYFTDMTISKHDDMCASSLRDRFLCHLHLQVCLSYPDCFLPPFWCPCPVEAMQFVQLPLVVWLQDSFLSKRECKEGNHFKILFLALRNLGMYKLEFKYARMCKNSARARRMAGFHYFTSKRCQAAELALQYKTHSC